MVNLSFNIELTPTADPNRTLVSNIGRAIIEKFAVKFEGNESDTPAQDKAIANAYANKFIIPLDFEMLDSAMPYYQAGLRNRLSYELKFNDYNRVINSSKTNAKYKITDISSEYDIVTQPKLARSIRSEYDKIVLSYPA